MGTALHIIILLIVAWLLWKVGFLPQLIFLGGAVLGFGLLGGIAWWIFGGGFSTGWNVGKWAAVAMMSLNNIYMIIADEGFEIEVFDDGKTEMHTERAKGIVGLLACIAMALLFIFWGKF